MGASEETQTEETEGEETEETEGKGVRGRGKKQSANLTPSFLFSPVFGPFAEATLVPPAKRSLTSRANQTTLGLTRNKVLRTDKSSHNTVLARELGADVKRRLTTVDQTSCLGQATPDELALRRNNTPLGGKTGDGREPVQREKELS